MMGEGVSGRLTVRTTVLIALVLAVAVATGTVVAQDQFEPNDTMEDAAPIEDGTYSGLQIGNDAGDDYYEVFVQEGQEIEVSIYFDHSQSDVDLALHDGDGQWVDSSWSTSDDEYVSHVPEESGSYFIEVEDYGGAGNTYTLDVQTTGTDGGSDDDTIGDDGNGISDDGSGSADDGSTGDDGSGTADDGSSNDSSGDDETDSDDGTADGDDESDDADDSDDGGSEDVERWSGSGDDDDDDGLPGFGFATAVAALIGAVAIARRRAAVRRD